MALTKINNNTLSAITGLPAGVGGKVLQVVTATTTTEVSTTGTTFVDGGLSQAITPSSTSSKIMILCSYLLRQDNSGKNAVTSIFRDSTNLAGGSYDLGRLRADTANVYTRQTITLLDEPSTSSEVTYTLKLKGGESGGSQRLHSNSAKGSITLMEVLG